MRAETAYNVAQELANKTGRAYFAVRYGRTWKFEPFTGKGVMVSTKPGKDSITAAAYFEPTYQDQSIPPDAPVEIDNELSDIWMAIAENDGASFTHHMKRVLELNRRLTREEEQQ